MADEGRGKMDEGRRRAREDGRWKDEKRGEMDAKRHKKHKNEISQLIISIGYEIEGESFDFLRDKWLIKLNS